MTIRYSIPFKPMTSKTYVPQPISALGNTIHDRYMKKNEIFLGHHFVGQAEDKKPKRSASVARSMTTRPPKFSPKSFVL